MTRKTLIAWSVLLISSVTLVACGGSGGGGDGGDGGTFNASGVATVTDENAAEMAVGATEGTKKSISSSVAPSGSVGLVGVVVSDREIGRHHPENGEFLPLLDDVAFADQELVDLPVRPGGDDACLPGHHVPHDDHFGLDVITSHHRRDTHLRGRSAAGRPGCFRSRTAAAATQPRQESEGQPGNVPV